MENDLEKMALNGPVTLVTADSEAKKYNECYICVERSQNYIWKPRQNQIQVTADDNPLNRSQKTYKGRLPTCPRSFEMKIGTKILSNMPIKKIIILAAAVGCGASYRPANFQKIDAGTVGRHHGLYLFWLIFNNKNVVYIVLRYVEFEFAIRL